MHTQRRLTHQEKNTQGPVVYWMSRDQRVQDNWALLYAFELAHQQQMPLAVLFCYWPAFAHATHRTLSWMLRGLQRTAHQLHQLQIPFFLIQDADPATAVAQWATKQGCATIVTDSSPLRFAKQWKQDLAKNFEGTIYEVDAHNIVPVWAASTKQEFAARTLRPKLHRLLDEWLIDFPTLPKQSATWPHPVPSINWAELLAKVPQDTLPSITWIDPATDPYNQLESFIENKLEHYDTQRNLPTVAGQSDLSIYLHFGQLSAQRVALEVNHALRQHPQLKVGAEAFLEELIVRRELADNYCWYQPEYDSPAGFPAWAQRTLAMHASDPREYLYSFDELEQAQTHDELWNACQQELVIRGKLHGYLRMYWGKKILEWTKSPSQAQTFAIKLNDTYSLDGRDPNGYTGIAWCIGGVHDRPWFERPIFGTIRYMSAASTGRKVGAKEYIRQINALKRQTT